MRVRASTGHATGVAASETLTVEEFRARLRIGRSLAYALVDNGAVPSIRLGRAIRVPAKWVDELLAQSQIGAREENDRTA